MMVTALLMDIELRFSIDASVKWEKPHCSQSFTADLSRQEFTLETNHRKINLEYLRIWEAFYITDP